VKCKRLTCRQPDKDCPKILCGHPLPCPYRTVVMDLTKKPPTINIPITSDAITVRDRLNEIAEALVK